MYLPTLTDQSSLSERYHPINHTRELQLYERHSNKVGGRIWVDASAKLDFAVEKDHNYWSIFGVPVLTYCTSKKLCALKYSILSWELTISTFKIVFTAVIWYADMEVGIYIVSEGEMEIEILLFVWWKCTQRGKNHREHDEKSAGPLPSFMWT